MVSYSAWVTIRPFVFRTVVALLAWTTVLVGLIAHGLNIFLHLSWWAFVSLALYETCTVLSFGVRGVFAAVCMVYAPFATIAYWSGVYPAHIPWYDPTTAYTVVLIDLLAVITTTLEIVIPRNTHRMTGTVTNPDFPVAYSFLINSVLYGVYLCVYAIALPDTGQPLYEGLGFTLDVERDLVLIVLGWPLLMTINAGIAGYTWWRHNLERKIEQEAIAERIQSRAINAGVL